MRVIISTNYRPHTPPVQSPETSGGRRTKMSEPEGSIKDATNLRIYLLKTDKESQVREHFLAALDDKQF